MEEIEMEELRGLIKARLDQYGTGAGDATKDKAIQELAGSIIATSRMKE
jgi:hypothetical protein